MAEIPVEKKTDSGLPWWLIPLILLLLLIPLLWFMARGCDTETPVVVNDNDNVNSADVTETNTMNSMDSNTNSAVGNDTNTIMNTNMDANQGDGAAGARLTDINVFGDTEDRLTLVDKGVDFKEAKVKRLLSDRVFTVESGGKEMFVLLDETLDMKIDNKLLRQVRPGDMIKITGDFRRVPDSPEDTMNTGLKEGEYKQMQENQVYLLARDLPEEL